MWTQLHDGANIFVFGSNELGLHGAGAALEARRHWGAKSGQGYGLQGKSFGVPTKRTTISRLSLPEIHRYVDGFLSFARMSPEYTFLVTRIGCGLAGYTDADIAPMFKNAPPNCKLSPEWRELLSR